MKKTIRIAALTLTLGLALQGAGNVFAETEGTISEQARMSSDKEGTPMKSREEFTSLRKGDKIVIHGKNDRGITTVITNVDDQGRAKWSTTKNGDQLEGSSLVLKRKPGSKEIE